MSTGARLFLVGSIGITGLIVYGVNYYIDEEKQVRSTQFLLIKHNEFVFRENDRIFSVKSRVVKNKNG